VCLSARKRESARVSRAREEKKSKNTSIVPFFPPLSRTLSFLFTSLSRERRRGKNECARERGREIERERTRERETERERKRTGINIFEKRKKREMILGQLDGVMDKEKIIFFSRV